jgi:hypothetical protein
VHKQTNAIINSGEYALFANYAGLFEIENESKIESIFEIQFSDAATGWGPPKTGTANNISRTTALPGAGASTTRRRTL